MAEGKLAGEGLQMVMKGKSEREREEWRREER